MLTIKQITTETERVIQGLEKKNVKNAKEAIAQVVESNERRKEAQTQLDNNLAEVKSISKSIGQLMKEGRKEEATTLRDQVASMKDGNKALEDAMNKATEEMNELLYNLPNVPHESVPVGTSAEDNKIERTGGKNPELPADALPHWELAKKYNLIDFELGVKITGAGFPVYTGKGARLQRALINFFLDEARDAGYLEIEPPFVVNAASGFGTGQLPDKEGQMYHVTVDDLYLIPTAEVPITNIYRDVILDEKDLPLKNCGFSACFRREAGSYGKDVRGLNRLHQFNKVEIVRIDTPEHSYESLDDPHYNITFVSGELVVFPRDISVKAEDTFKYYGGEDPAVDFVLYLGTLQFEDELSTILRGEVSRVAGEDVGEYEITQGTLSAGENYNLTFVSGKLFIYAQELLVKLKDAT